MRTQDYMPKSIAKVVDVNLLPLPFNSMKVITKDPTNARPTLIHFFKGDSNNGGILLMEMTVTYDVDGDFESAHTVVVQN